MLDNDIIAAHHQALLELDKTADQLQNQLDLLASVANTEQVPRAKRLIRSIQYQKDIIVQGSGYLFDLFDRISIVANVATISLSEPNNVPEQVLAAVMQTFEAERVALILDDENFTVKLIRVNPDSVLSKEPFIYSTGAIRRIKDSNDTILIENAQLDPELKTHESVLLGRLRSIICIHLVVRDRSIGFLYADNPTQDSVFDQSMLPLLRMLGDQLAIALDNVWLFERMTKELERANALSAELQLLTQRVATTREEERRQLASDLHDDLGTALVGLVNTANGIERMIAEKPDSALEMTAKLKTSLEEAHAQIRQIAHHQYPPMLRYFGLIKALEQHIREIPTIAVWFCRPDRLPSLMIAVESAVYRIALEALANVTRHSKANTCRVTLSASETELRLEVMDNGRGLSTYFQPGLGIQSMKDRAAELGGSLDIQSTTGKGTTITVQIPLLKVTTS